MRPCCITSAWRTRWCIAWPSGSIIPALSGDLIRQTYVEALRDTIPIIGNAFRADLVAVYRPRSRDLALHRSLALLQGLPRHADRIVLRIGCMQKGRKDFAYYLQSRSSAVFQTDIHPAASIGRGIFLDHATGFVVGETAVIEDDVSILQGVTLGGTGKENEDRHPKIRRGVLIGAGAKILGNIEVGHCARIAAGSVVRQAGAAQCHGRGRAGENRRRGRLCRAVAHHGSDAQRDRSLILFAF